MAKSRTMPYLSGICHTCAGDPRCHSQVIGQCVQCHQRMTISHLVRVQVTAVSDLAVNICMPCYQRSSAPKGGGNGTAGTTPSGIQNA